MKVTLDIPEELYRQVKAKSVVLGLSIRQITTELYAAWLSDNPPANSTPSAEQWLAEWTRLGEEALLDTHSGPSAVDILSNDRNRLERRRGTLTD